MFIPLWVLITVFWIFCAILCIYKQRKTDGDDWEPIFVFVITVFAPLVFIGAIIRQVIIEDWK